ncbi:MAG: hypothetical protein ACLP07_03145 [Terracidiphilus sp.]
MFEKPKGGLCLPKFRRNAKQRGWIASERRSSNLIRALWNAAGQNQRSDPAFLRLLVQLGWTNRGGGDASRHWRNRKLAEYLQVPYASEQKLMEGLHSKFRSISSKHWQAMLEMRTGIALYYTAYRPATLSFVTRHSGAIAVAFKQVSTHAANIHEKVRRVAHLIESLGKIRAAGKLIDPFKGLTPVLSCLDPQCRFPMMNKRTRDLLACIGEKSNEEGIVALSKLIGSGYGIRDARDLDVYANTETFPKLRTHLANQRTKSDDFRDIGLKSEINSLAQIAARRTTIRKLHNKLTNRLRDYLLWRHVTPKESRFDAFVIGWRGDRDLLIEAKTASDGTTGRSQIRQAIGQLYDYRFTSLHAKEKTVDLAVLLPKEPHGDIKTLLNSLGIELLWFKRKNLTGTIQL